MRISSINILCVAFVVILNLASFTSAIQEQEKDNKPKFTFPIKGKVIDEAGNPVAGALVRINQPDIATEPVTNADGEFTVMASPLHVQQQFMIASNEDGSLQGVFKLPYQPEGKELAGLEIQIQPTQSITLVVADENGQPLPEAHVGVVAGFRPLHQTKTDEGGKANFDIPVGLKKTSVFAS